MPVTRALKVRMQLRLNFRPYLQADALETMSKRQKRIIQQGMQVIDQQAEAVQSIVLNQAPLGRKTLLAITSRGACFEDSNCHSCDVVDA